MKITKHHIARIGRIIISIIAATYILITIGIVNRVFTYIFVKWNIDIVQNNIDSSIPVEFILMLMIWNYVVGFTVIALIWKYIGLPEETVIGKLYNGYKRFMDVYRV